MSALAACGLALILLHDVSASVDQPEYVAQSRGTAEAFRDPEIHRALAANGRVRVALVEWADRPQRRIDWTDIQGPGDAERFAAEVAGLQRSREGMVGGWTALGTALAFALDMLEAEMGECDRAVIDVAGDGVANYGRNVGPERDRATALGVTINAVAVMQEVGSTSMLGDDRNLDDYYREEVVTPSGFVVRAAGYSEFGPAIRRKLIMEITQATPGPRG